MNNSSSTTAPFAPRLLTWFEQHGRHDLPWQQDKTPYRVWLERVWMTLPLADVNTAMRSELDASQLLFHVKA